MTNTRKWVRHDRELKKGDILRTSFNDGYLYSICDGCGFGCHPNSRGNAIYVKFESTSLETVLAHRDDPDESIVGYRWERFWGIEYLVEEGDNATHA